jgi:hypothetical protein
MSILKGLFQKIESSCCNVKIEEVKEEMKVQPQDVQKNGCCK